MRSNSSDFFKCKRCDNEFPTKYNVCGRCGEVAGPFNVSQEEKIEVHLIEKYPQELIKKIRHQLSEEYKQRAKIVSINKKLEDLITIPSNHTGFVKINANGSDLRVSEGAYRTIVQKDVNDLVEQLNIALSALEQFNNRFK